MVDWCTVTESAQRERSPLTHSGLAEALSPSVAGRLGLHQAALGSCSPHDTLRRDNQERSTAGNRSAEAFGAAALSAMVRDLQARRSYCLTPRGLQAVAPHWRHAHVRADHLVSVGGGAVRRTLRSSRQLSNDVMRLVPRSMISRFLSLATGSNESIPLWLYR